MVSHIEVATFATFVKNSELKLKMIWMFLEFLDIVLKRYGLQNLIYIFYLLSGDTLVGSFFWSLIVSHKKLRWSRLSHFLVSFGYMILHSLLLLLHISVLDIAINSKNITLLALVVLVQFAEVKAAAMK